jgi:hypothetical protein
MATVAMAASDVVGATLAVEVDQVEEEADGAAGVHLPMFLPATGLVQIPAVATWISRDVMSATAARHPDPTTPTLPSVAAEEGEHLSGPILQAALSAEAEETAAVVEALVVAGAIAVVVVIAVVAVIAAAMVEVIVTGAVIADVTTTEETKTGNAVEVDHVVAAGAKRWSFSLQHLLRAVGELFRLLGIKSVRAA